MRGNILLVSRWQDCRGLAFTKGLCQVLGLILLYMTFKHKTFSEYGPRVHTGTGTKFVAYLSPSPTLLKHEMDIYWPILKNKVTKNKYSSYST